MDKITTKQCADLLGISPATLESARCRGQEGYPPFYKIGRRVVYSRSEVERWMQTCRITRRAA